MKGASRARDDDEQFYKDLSKDDSLTVTIKAAIYVEQYVERLLSAALYDHDVLEKVDLTYFQRVHLAVACGLPRRFLGPLKALGEIRNKFAHILRDEVTAADMDAFYNTFAPEEKTLIQETYAKLNRLGVGGRKRPKRIASLPPLERFQLFVTTLRGALVVAAREVESGSPSPKLANQDGRNRSEHGGDPDDRS